MTPQDDFLPVRRDFYDLRTLYHTGDAPPLADWPASSLAHLWHDIEAGEPSEPAEFGACGPDTEPPVVPSGLADFSRGRAQFVTPSLREAEARALQGDEREQPREFAAWLQRPLRRALWGVLAAVAVGVGLCVWRAWPVLAGTARWLVTHGGGGRP